MVWFGILVEKMIEIALITPPVGIILFPEIVLWLPRTMLGP